MKRLWLMLLLVAGASLPAQADDWTVHTNVRSARRLLVDSGHVYTVTWGGLCRYDDSIGGYRIFNSADGLGNHDLYGAARAGDTFWLGGEGAVLTRFEPQSGAARVFPLQLGVGRIESILSAGDTLWIGTDIGVGLFLKSVGNGLLKEVYTRLGNLPAETPVVDLKLFDGRLWAATAEGLVSADPTDPALHVSTSWMNHTDSTGALRSSRRLDVWRDSLFAASDSGLFVSADTIFAQRFPGRSIQGLFAEPDTLWLASDSGVYYYTTDTLASLPSLTLIGARIEDVARVPGGHLWATVAGLDVRFYDPVRTWFASISTNQPQGRIMDGVALTGNVVWCAMRQAGGGLLGVTGAWGTIDTLPPSVGAPTFAVREWLGRVFYMRWGFGFLELQPSGGQVNVTAYDATNSALAPVVNGSAFTVVADVAIAPDGGIWAANRKTFNGQSLVYFGFGGSPQVIYGISEGLNNNEMNVLLLTESLLWIGYDGGGLGVLDFNSTPLTPADDTFRLYTSDQDHLPSDVITALVEDHNGMIWAGTPGGLARIDREFFPFISVDLAEVAPADGEILALAADAGNDIWVGTGNGLTRILNESLVADSAWFSGPTPLPHDRVLALALGDGDSTLWIGTENGLAAKPILARDNAGAADSSALVFPNPLHIRYSGDVATFAVGSGSRVDIYTLAGDRVRSLTSRYIWDGFNESGNLVASGLYIFRVKFPDGSQAHGRLGVIREQ